MYEEGAGTDRMHQKWFAKFHAGDCSLDDAPWLGRPIGVDSDQIETLVENNQRYTTQKIADKLKIFKSIKLLVNMKKFVFYIMGEKTHTLVGQQYYQRHHLYFVIKVPRGHLFGIIILVKTQTWHHDSKWHGLFLLLVFTLLLRGNPKIRPRCKWSKQHRRTRRTLLGSDP